MLCSTCPEGGGLPMLVIMSEAGEARHAASVIITQALQELPQLFAAFLLFHQPLLLIFGGHSTRLKEPISSLSTVISSLSTVTTVFL